MRTEIRNAAVAQLVLHAGGMNDSSVTPSPATTVERWPEMVGLMGELVLRAIGVGIAAGSLLLLTASALV
jgi:hypothetical protein